MEGTIEIFLPNVKKIKMWHGSEDPTYHICFGDGLEINFTKSELNKFTKKLQEFNDQVQTEKYKPYENVQMTFER
jgi:hypothetical protein